MELLILGCLVLLLSVIGQLNQEKFKIPASGTVLFVALCLKYFAYDWYVVSNPLFDQLLLLLLPLLLAVDILHLKLKDLKEHAISLFYIAGISVALSVLSGVLLSHLIFPEYNLSIPVLVMLFCMVSATDPVAVGAVFSNFKVPHKLKVLVEGESLFNDATALIAFNLAAIFYVMGDQVTAELVITKSSLIILGAVGIGAVFGGLGYFLLKLTTNPDTETLIILLITFGSFLCTEYFHYSGIISVITALLIANHVIIKRIEKNDGDTLVSKENHEKVFNNIKFSAVIGVTVLFLSIGNLVNFENLVLYWKEILSVFFATTLIRAVMMFKFSLISRKITKMQNIPLHWYKILVFAGIKGGLSILMLHMMPKGIDHIQMIEAVVIGVILLTTFIYPALLTATMKWHSAKFESAEG